MAFRLGQETLQRPLAFTGKLVEHHAQTPVRKFLMLTVCPSIAEGFLVFYAPGHNTVRYTTPLFPHLPRLYTAIAITCF